MNMIPTPSYHTLDLFPPAFLIGGPVISTQTHSKERKRKLTLWNHVREKAFRDNQIWLPNLTRIMIQKVQFFGRKCSLTQSKGSKSPKMSVMMSYFQLILVSKKEDVPQRSYKLLKIIFIWLRKVKQVFRYILKLLRDEIKIYILKFMPNLQKSEFLESKKPPNVTKNSLFFASIDFMKP